MSNAFLVYTDGSCWTGDRIGAYAWVLLGEDDLHHMGGEAAHDTTISRMELQGPIEALKYIQQVYGSSIVQVHSDSEYVVLGITNRSRARKKNVDLWDELDAAVDTHEFVVFDHVKGHAGNEYNELCDKHAGNLRNAARNGNPSPQPQ